MKNLLLSVIAISMLFGCSEKKEKAQEAKLEKILQIHQGSFAFCGASGAVPTGRKIIVQGVEYDEGCAICPVLNGPSISNLAIRGVSGTWGEFDAEKYFQTPDGTDKTVWSLFWYYDTTTKVPQFNPSTKSWEYMTPNNRMFVINTDQPNTSESNMFQMPGTIIDTLENGIVLAKCYGPMNEAAIPLRKAFPVESGMTSVTAAKEGAPYPVGTPIPLNSSYFKK
jgi:hypothetical protein